MAKPATRAYSRYSREAAKMLGAAIRQNRIERHLTVAELAERADISRGLVQRIERGEMGCAIGAVFELAAIVGVDSKESVLAKYGEPSLIGTFDRNAWYYVSALDASRAFFRPKTTARTCLSSGTQIPTTSAARP